MKVLNYLFFILFLGYSANAQDPVVFIDVSEKMANNLSSHNGIAFCDVNGDYRDDLVRAADQKIYVCKNINNGEQFQAYAEWPLFTEHAIWTMNVADLNNDGFNDITYSGSNSGVDSYISKGKESGFSHQYYSDLNGVSHLAQGSAMNDVNNDGYVDFLFTNDVGNNIICINDKNGNLIPDDFIDFSTVPASDNRGNYSSIWFDADQDDDLDIFISKCRWLENDPEHLDRINMLFINENGSFIESAKSFELNSGEQSWAADSGDFDNDGDIDLFILNHGNAHFLMENLGDGSFAKHEDFGENGVITGIGLQLSIVDLNNDGLLDIVVAGSNDMILLNKGAFQFDVYNDPFGLKNASSFAIGDINADGYMDVCLTYVNSEELKDELWQNLGGTNNFVSFSLNGTTSNRSGIGAKVTVRGEWGSYVRWLKSGVGYGITNTLNLHFGLEKHNRIDEVEILWPSGHTDIYTNLEVNKHFVATENACLVERMHILSNNLGVCADQPLKLNTSENVLWSNGNQTDSLYVTSTGTYFATSSNETCYNNSQILQLEVTSLPIKPVLSITGSYTLCPGIVLPVTTTQEDKTKWNNSEIENTETILVNQPGVYQSQNENVCGVVFSDTLEINFAQETIRDTSIVINGPAEVLNISVQGNNIEWFDEEIETGSQLTVYDIQSDTTFRFRETFETSSPIVSVLGPIESSIQDSFSINFNERDRTLFQTNAQILLKSLTVNALSAGLRKFIMKNVASGDTIKTLTLDLVEGPQKIVWDVLLESATTIEITTDTEQNEATFFRRHPVLKLADPVPFENYDIKNGMRLLTGGSNYFCYFEWEYEHIFDTCHSEWKSFSIVVDNVSSTLDYDDTDVFIYPNPASQTLHFKSNVIIKDIEIYDANVQHVLLNRADNSYFAMDVHTLKSGVYYAKCYSAHGIYTKRFVVAK